jgi:hypothetical protein
MVSEGRVTEALTRQRALVVTSPTILAHGSMPWESRTMVAVAVQGAPRMKSIGSGVIRYCGLFVPAPPTDISRK